MKIWEVFAVKYAERNNRIRGDSFLFDEAHDAPHPMDYFMWLLRCGDEQVLVDTGYDETEANARGRPIQLNPGAALEPLGVEPENITQLIVTHLHYDHAGGLEHFPNATLHMQAAELAFATGPCMCHDTLRSPFTAGHVCEAVKRLYSGKVQFHDGDGQISEGVTVHRIGGHSRGLQCVRVLTSVGWMVLASDASHYYENFETRKPFPIVVDLADMLDGFETLYRLASAPNLIVPGHDPLLRDRFPKGPASHISRLDHGQVKGLSA